MIIIINDYYHFFFIFFLFIIFFLIFFFYDINFQFCYQFSIIINIIIITSITGYFIIQYSLYVYIFMYVIPAVSVYVLLLLSQSKLQSIIIITSPTWIISIIMQVSDCIPPRILMDNWRSYVLLSPR